MIKLRNMLKKQSRSNNPSTRIIETKFDDTSDKVKILDFNDKRKQTYLMRRRQTEIDN